MTDKQPATTDIDPAYPDALEDLEENLVRVRRHACDLDPDGPRIGFGLSGGGIRSATFCLGVFQALAKAKTGKPGGLLGRIDFLSTVSGGGYFGAFLGRLFARIYVHNADDVANVLTGSPKAPTGAATFRFLRDNGRYLAPRGSGDLLGLITVTMRNWLAVQTVLALFALTVFVALQAGDIGLSLPTPFWGHFELPEDMGLYDGICTKLGLCLPETTTTIVPLVWSRWLLFLVPIAALWVLPTAWAYWVIALPLSKRQLLRRTDLVVLGLLAAAWRLGWIPPGAPQVAAIVIAVVAGAATVWSVISGPMASLNWLFWAFGAENPREAITDSTRSRNRLTRWLKNGLVAFAVFAVVGVVDGLGATTYAVARAGDFTKIATALGSVFGALGGVAAFGRQILVFLGGERRSGGVRVPFSILSWLGAVVVLGAWLITLSAVSHSVAWRGETPKFAIDLMKPAKEETADATATCCCCTKCPADCPKPVAAAAAADKELSVAKQRDEEFTLHVLLLLAALVAAVGTVRSLINASSLHAFYAQRLTRAYLGASNRERLENAAHVTDVIPDDDLASDHYWNWPRPKRERSLVGKARDAVAGGFRKMYSWFGGQSERAPAAPQPAQTNAAKGAPLHLVNVTINETLDGRTGVQIQDRKGVPLAVGPGGFSVGVRHHLIANEEQGFIARPEGDGHAVFTRENLDYEPEVMTLGRWVSLSGAAFSSALGARTSVPLAMLATFANVRLGYWWDSGVGKGWTGPLLPVYRGLFSELLARLRGTGIRLWNLTDGGHFENLGGYELIRRKLPLIVLIDAEADPDFEFPGLSELIRKARLDFGAEISFLDEDTLAREGYAKEFPPVFTTLERLRRGPWNAEGGRAALSAESDRRQYSYAHAALASVTYRDGSVGRIVYVKASITGREPADVLQYHAEHPDFPHETTSDQFFDEAQWESYRRLGEQVGLTTVTSDVFHFAGR